MKGKTANSSPGTRRGAAPNNAASDSPATNNYFTPLQTLMDNETINENTSQEASATIANSERKIPKPPPINVIKVSSKYIHDKLSDVNIADYVVKRMSIGIKILPNNMDTSKSICNRLDELKCEYYTHSTKTNLPFKVTLTGLDEIEAVDLKTYLLSVGVKCTDVKSVIRKTRQGQTTLYIVYIERGSITLKELRDKHGIIDRTVVKWDFHRKLPNKVTQCYNCQMYGHGANHCRIKTFCAYCSGPHKTSDCKSQDVVKCANCNGSHKSNDPLCPSRRAYVEFREKLAVKKPANTFTSHGYAPRSADFPPLPRSTQTQRSTFNPSWSSVRFNNNTNLNANASSDSHNHNLFSLNELQMLASELVNRLRICKDKFEQFSVITELALKYLSNGP